MGRKNAYLTRVQAGVEAKISYHRRFTTQWCADAAILAANEVFQRRGEKIVEFANTFARYANEIARMTLEDAKDDNELVYTKEKVDARLKEILGDAFQPWDERYSDI